MIISVGPMYTNIDDSGYHTTKVASKLQGYRRSPNQELLPPGLRMIGPRGDYWVFERPPKNLCGHTSNGRFFQVLLPWTVFIVEQVRIRVFARPDPIRQPDDLLYTLPLPGIKEDGTVRFKPNGKNIGTIMRRAFVRFDDFIWEGPLLNPPKDWPLDPLQLLDHWGDIKSVAEICAVPWHQYVEPVAGVLDSIDWSTEDPLQLIVEAANG